MAGGVPLTRAGVPLQPLGQHMVRQLCPCSPWGSMRSRDPPAAPPEPHAGAGGCPEDVLILWAAHDCNFSVLALCPYLNPPFALFSLLCPAEDGCDRAASWAPGVQPGSTHHRRPIHSKMRLYIAPCHKLFTAKERGRHLSCQLLTTFLSPSALPRFSISNRISQRKRPVI